MRRLHLPLAGLVLLGACYLSLRVFSGHLISGFILGALVLVFAEWVLERTDEKLTGALVMGSLITSFALLPSIFWYLPPVGQSLSFAVLGLTIGVPARFLLDEHEDDRTNRWIVTGVASLISILVALNLLVLNSIGNSAVAGLIAAGAENFHSIHPLASLAPGLLFLLGVLGPSFRRDRWLQLVVPLTLLTAAWSLGLYAVDAILPLLEMR